MPNNNLVITDDSEKILDHFAEWYIEYPASGYIVSYPLQQLAQKNYKPKFEKFIKSREVQQKLKHLTNTIIEEYACCWLDEVIGYTPSEHQLRQWIHHEIQYQLLDELEYNHEIETEEREKVSKIDK